ncbi:MAG TPA: tRNA 2-thiouridine(34) synthase MnmA [Bacillota bacterium]|nr:tRNA 2-thiouridine(34) synthase MnmA [Bacillota bacterium]HPO79860.1 tRNA 2-thiouridine(34) synthase MnmA [Bacillota bacterium]
MDYPSSIPDIRGTGPGARVIVAISGGVDSSVAALLLKSKGFQVIGVTLRIWEAFPSDDAKAVADFLDIPHHILDVAEPFRNEIVKYFVSCYFQGRTPNPCVLCNAQIKFRYLLDLAKKLAAGYVATGHYARIAFDSAGERFLLLKGLDQSKDQSYVLHRLTQQDLSSILFPLGDLTKEQVREAAFDAGIPVAGSSESQEICFLAGTDYRDFLRGYGTHIIKPGPILDTSGRPIGRHKGIPFYTVGQRKGLEIPGNKRLYVTRIDVSRNAIIVGEEGDLLSERLEARDVNWIPFSKPPEKMHLGIKIRYTAKEVPGSVLPKSQDMAEVVFDEPQKAVTPGQFAVFYDGDIVVGGGVIV